MERKLRCDRTWPSCSRCSKAGLSNSCRYETEPSKNGGQDDSVTDDDDETSQARYHHHVPNTDGTASATARHPTTTTTTTAEGPSWAQSKKMSQLENRIANIEALANQSSNNLRSRILEVSQPDSPKTLIGCKQKSRETEAMIFRKSSFGMSLISLYKTSLFFIWYFFFR